MSVFHTDNPPFYSNDRGSVSNRGSLGSESFMDHLRKVSEEKSGDRKEETQSERRVRENAEFAKKDATRQEEISKRETTRNDNRTDEDQKAFERRSEAKSDRIEYFNEKSTAKGKSSESADSSTSASSDFRRGFQGAGIPDPQHSMVDGTKNSSTIPGNNIDFSKPTMTSGIANPQATAATDPMISGNPMLNTVQATISIGSNLLSSVTVNKSVEAMNRSVLAESIIFNGMPLVAPQVQPRKNAWKSGELEDDRSDSGESETFETETENEFSGKLKEFSGRNSATNGQTPQSQIPSGFNNATEFKSIAGNQEMNPELAAAFREAAEAKESNRENDRNENIAEPDGFEKTLSRAVRESGHPLENENEIRANRTRFLQRIASVVQSGYARNGTIRMKLAPEELGSIGLNIKVRGKKMEISIETETEEAQKILQDGMKELESILEELGMELSATEVKLSNHLAATPE